MCNSKSIPPINHMTGVAEVPAEWRFEGVWSNLHCVYWPAPASLSPDPAARSACHNPPSGSREALFYTSKSLIYK